MLAIRVSLGLGLSTRGATRRWLSLGASSGGGGAGASSSSSGASAAAAESGAAAKPRAAGSGEVGRRKRRLARYAVAGGTAAFAAYLGYQNDFDLKKLSAKASETWRSLTERTTGDPNIEDLQKALGPPPPEGYINVLMAVEGVLLRRDWDRRYGWVYEPRAGIKELLRSLTDPSAAVFLTLWSENTAGVANEEMDKLSQAINGPAAHTAPLGSEHMFLRESPTRKEKRLEYFARDPRTLLLIDCDPGSEALNPNNTVLVRAMPAPGGEGGSGGAGGAPDATLAAIKALIARLREDAGGWGQVNVPRSLAALRSEALSEGYSSDAAGLYALLQAQAAREAEVERERRETGLGGALRRAAAASPTLRSKAATAEAAARRPYRDPAIELGNSGLLARKVHLAASRVLGPAGGGGGGQ